MSSTSKIARLPKSLRNQLGLRLEDGLPGKDILQWLNAQPETRHIVDQYFDGSLITEQNLSDWRHSGHPQWLRRQETRQTALDLAEDADDLADDASRNNLADRFGLILAVEFNRLLAELAQKDSTPEKRWERLCHLNRELALLRRHDHQAARLALERERWQHQLHQEAKAEQAHQQAAQKQELIDLARSAGQKQLDATLLGGGDHGQQMAELIHRLRHDPTPPSPTPQSTTPNSALPNSAFRTPPSALGKPLDNQAPSSPIVPDKANPLIQQSSAPTFQPPTHPTIQQPTDAPIHPSSHPTIHPSTDPSIQQSTNPTIQQPAAPAIPPSAGVPATGVLADWTIFQYLLTAGDQLAARPTAQERFDLLHQVVGDLVALQRGGHWAPRLQIEREKLEFERTKHRETFAAAHPEPGKRPDYERPLTDAERLAIVDKVDEILGIKPAPPEL